MKMLCLTAVAVGIAAVALAQTIENAAFGRGIARNAEGLPAAFAFEVNKGHTEDGRMITRGSFKVTYGAARYPDRQVSVSMPEVHRAAFDGHVVRFTGKAVLSRIVNGETRRVRGTAEVTAIDRRAAGVTTRDPDAISVVWKNQAGVVVNSFRGQLASGDIVIRRREP